MYVSNDPVSESPVKTAVDPFCVFNSIVLLQCKLRWFIINEQVISWIQEYLTLKFQYVEVSGAKSGVARVTSGIPQGFVLGPLLFFIFINDLPNAIISCVRLFGDDLKIYTCIASTVILRNGLVKIQNWCRESHVQITTQNTFHVRFMRRCMPATCTVLTRIMDALFLP